MSTNQNESKPVGEQATYPEPDVDTPPETKGYVHEEERNDYNDSKLIVIRKTEIEADQYKKSPILTALLLFSAFLIGYGYGLDGNVRYVYTAQASASYGHHSLISTIGVINAVIGAASQILYARLSDVYGRLRLLITAIVFYVVGTIIQCKANDIQKYCAGAVFYNLGYVGVLLIVLLILSDASSLRWRLFYQFIPTLPFIINTWISGNVTEAVGLEHWSWGIAMWAFIFPLSSLPFICCLLHMKFLARNDPEYLELKRQKTYYQKNGLWNTLSELFWRLDVIGVFVMIVCLGCLLVPLTLASNVSSRWSSGKIIGPLVLGVVLIPVWVVIQSKVSKYPMAPFHLLKDRGIWSALALSFLLDFIFYMATDYLYTVLIVSVNQSIKSATRITSLSSFTSTVWSPLFSLIVAYFRRLKPFIVMGVSIWFLACGLLYHFRGGESAKSGIIGGLVVWGIGTTMFTYPIAVSMQSATTHEHMATVTALSYVLYRVGTAVGNSVSGAIWTQLLPDRLERNLGNATMAAEVFADPYVFCNNYPYGTPERSAVVSAYIYIQKLETLVALVFCVLLVGFSLFLRDPKLTDKVAYEEAEIGGDDVVKTDDAIFGKTFGRIFGSGKQNVTSSATEDTDSVEKAPVNTAT